MCDCINDSLDGIYDQLNDLQTETSDIDVMRDNINMLLNGVTDKNLVISKKLDDDQEERIRNIELMFSQIQLSIGALKERVEMKDRAQLELLKSLMDKINGTLNENK